MMRAETTTGLRWILSLPVVSEVYDALVGTRAVRRAFARQHIRPIPGANVLDLGCGPARMLEHLPPFNIQHNHFFSKTTLRRLFLKHGFAVADVRGTWNRYSLGYFIENIPAVPAPAKKQIVRWADARAELVWLATWPSTSTPSNLRKSLKVR